MRLPGSASWSATAPRYGCLCLPRVSRQVADGWNIAEGTVAALGTPVSPEFAAMSADEKALLMTTLWGNGTASTLVVPAPSTVGTIRRRVEHMARDSGYPPAVQEAARAWLTRG